MLIDSRAFLDRVIALLQEQGCTELVALDLRGLSDVADYVVVATSLNRTQGRAAMDYLRVLSKQCGMQAYSRPDNKSDRWMIADFVDVVVHVFSQEWREYYDIEMLWGDAPRIEIPPPGELQSGLDLSKTSDEPADDQPTDNAEPDDTDAEMAALEAQLRQERDRAAAARAAES